MTCFLFLSINATYAVLVLASRAERAGPLLQSQQRLGAPAQYLKFDREASVRRPRSDGVISHNLLRFLSWSEFLRNCQEPGALASLLEGEIL
jgi:hypothetical protein